MRTRRSSPDTPEDTIGAGVSIRIGLRASGNTGASGGGADARYAGSGWSVIAGGGAIGTAAIGAGGGGATGAAMTGGAGGGFGGAGGGATIFGATGFGGGG